MVAITIQPESIFAGDSNLIVNWDPEEERIEGLI